MREAGSSPLTRGKHGDGLDVNLSAGLIPAHAGKTVDRAQRRETLRAHPRSRGENSRSACRRATSAGSSPLTRGKRTCWGSWGFCWGLIPAHAGKTCSCIAGELVAGAHPRSRGENLLRKHDPVIRGGSSPLTRGKRGGAGGLPLELGLIPAHAGKTVWMPDQAACM